MDVVNDIMMQLLIPIASVFIHIMHVFFVLHYFSVGMVIALVFTKSRCSHGTISLQSGLPQGKQAAEYLRVIEILCEKANKYACPIGHEVLDFSKKKETLREQGYKYSRMLSGWGYKKFFDLLKSYCNNRGIYVYDKIRPEYSSIAGMVKVARMYGLGSDVSAAYILARRFMRLKERVPASLYAYPDVKLIGKSVWSQWNQLNKFLKSRGVINRRHDYYTISNWESEVTRWESKSSY
ncbi:MAG: hypothetical protein AAFY21_18040 [Cyanobacteria bacterium J06641_2]